MQRRRWAKFIPLIEDLKAQSDGPIADMDPLTIGGLMSGSLGWLMVHKEEYATFESELDIIDEGFYDHIQRTLITTLARGLTAEQ